MIRIKKESIIEEVTIEICDETYTFAMTLNGYFRKLHSDNEWVKITKQQYMTAKIFFNEEINVSI